ncbi:MAG: hypothetical protein Q8K93_34980 [Reyranella sp.]|nr:hypothetical protein [Reyranella sp.]
MPDLASRFSALPPNQKAMFLAQVAHFATVAARESYAPDERHPGRDYDHPDGIILRDANNFVHRVTGYTMHVLQSTEGSGQDASVMEMIVDFARIWRFEARLQEWLPQ